MPMRWHNKGTLNAVCECWDHLLLENQCSGTLSVVLQGVANKNVFWVPLSMLSPQTSPPVFYMAIPWHTMESAPLFHKIGFFKSRRSYHSESRFEFHLLWHRTKPPKSIPSISVFHDEANDARHKKTDPSPPILLWVWQRQRPYRLFSRDARHLCNLYDHIQDISDSHILLQAAVKSKSTDVVKFLLERGGNPNQLCRSTNIHQFGWIDGATLLHTALELRNTKIVNQMIILLLNNGR